MNLKKYFKPTKANMILGIALFMLSYIISGAVSSVSDYWAYGFPLRFQESWGPCPPGEVCHSFNLLFFILDILFWYLISGLMVKVIRIKKSEDICQNQKF